MHVGTTLPQVVFMGTGALGQGANGRAWPYNWTCNFKYLSTCSTWARPRQVSWGLSRLVQTPDGFTSQDYLGT